MRKLFIGVAAIAVSLPSAPAFAQYGGSPDQQLQDYQQRDQYVEDEDAPDDRANDGADAAKDVDEAYGDAHVEVDADVDADVDQDVDVDQDADVEPDVDRQQAWRGEDGRTYCRRSDGTTGLIVGGGAGALVGRGIDRRGERATGTIIGAIAGALIGSAVERSANCR